MENSKALGYLCAGLGVGGALGMLLAPNSGPKTREQLRDMAERGRERVKAGAREIGDVIDRRGDILEAGKQHVSESVAVGRSAYRDATATASTPPISGLATLGLLVLQAAALTAGYKLVAGLEKNVGGVRPQLEGLLTASRQAVEEGTGEICAVASKAHSVLSAVEQTLHALGERMG